jgi:hypothetical protein
LKTLKPQKSLRLSQPIIASIGFMVGGGVETFGEARAVGK